ncbi:CD48 antigen isoform X2 [Austrofundulus limnaeus]|uniref:CD48 antigen isoform X2 n=1 Tax=Austrofundulus limnaeus TaxID=52670 RepID=A0A2I4C1C2_AUSLI|nr:PREDICTED: CD48 antigen-like isoform X2 [Austrofundulus limnaeus]
MWIKTFLCLVVRMMMMMIVSAAEDVKNNLTGLIGGNVTFPDSVKEFGFFLKGRQNIGLVTKGKFEIAEDIYEKNLFWDRNSGLFTLTDLQKNNSGIYTIDSKKGDVLTLSYALTVYDWAPTPQVNSQNWSSDSCKLLCSVDKQVTLVWYRDQEILNQSSSELSLPVTVHKHNRHSDYKCVAANPADRKTLQVNLEESCGFIQSQNGNNPTRNYGIGIGVTAGFIVLILFCACLIKQKYVKKEKKTRQRQGRSRRGSPIYVNTNPK